MNRIQALRIINRVCPDDITVRSTLVLDDKESVVKEAVIYLPKTLLDLDVYLNKVAFTGDLTDEEFGSIYSYIDDYVDHYVKMIFGDDIFIRGHLECNEGEMKFELTRENNY